MNAIRIIALFVFVAAVLAAGFVMVAATGGIGAMLFLAASPLVLAFMVHLASRPPFFDNQFL